ncbi:hypothetical protein UMM65_11770 [Aureibaculum sp. 2210JD6-5]|uniref:hypothetical protein n=1 Tax=Aureibaculum sp. 2210JD6-5 TaxID=3103957 RepID=UPI002AAC7E09|nr:hypothetical protein [Aureibaculum sp. 2210JD6-5]MDY7395925.1 hypothetical protein [Aureibaculum sp. 2210JD6-5]
MAVKKILITVTTYPLPSRSYDELVCTAGVLEDGSWIRVYPIPLSFLNQIKKDTGFKKYTWIELDVKERTDDFRPESHSPCNYRFKIIDTLDTKNYWKERKHFCLKDVYTNKAKLLADSKNPTNVSLATFKPSKITKFLVEGDSKEWKDEWVELRKQTDLFAEIDANPEKLIPKVPYKFSYVFEDDEGVSSKLMIEDWEIFQLYWNCLKDAKGNKEIAIEKVKQKYFDTFVSQNDIYLFLGTTMEWHRRRAPNPFVIIGVFYPKKENQLSLEL